MLPPIPKARRAFCLWRRPPALALAPTSGLPKAVPSPRQMVYACARGTARALVGAASAAPPQGRPRPLLGRGMGVTLGRDWQWGGWGVCIRPRVERAAHVSQGKNGGPRAAPRSVDGHGARRKNHRHRLSTPHSCRSCSTVVHSLASDPREPSSIDCDRPRPDSIDSPRDPYPPAQADAREFYTLYTKWAVSWWVWP